MNDLTPLSSSHTRTISAGSSRVLQTIVFILTLVVVAGLFFWEDLTLLVFWNILIPILPASFLISPSLWRAVCPLASANMLGNGLVSKRVASRKALFRAEMVALVLLLVMVPARRFLFNTNGPVLAITIVAIGLSAFVLGFFYASKAGFCNSICPVLPVEKLYGQRPLLDLLNPRCPTCDVCTTKGCIDLAPPKALNHSIGAHTKKNWLFQPFGIFAASFPGFIIAYFTLENTAIENAGAVYVHVLLFALASYATTATVVVLRKARATTAAPVMGAFSIGLFYWYAGPAIATSLSADPVVGTGIRVVGLLLVGYWFQRAFRQIPNAPRQDRPIPIVK